MGGGRTSLQPVMRPDVTWQPKLHTLASGLRELGCHSSSSFPSTSTARRPAFQHQRGSTPTCPTPMHTWNDATTSELCVAPRPMTIPIGISIHPANANSFFLLPTSTSQPRPTTDRRQHISTSWTPSAGSFFYGTTGRAQFQAPPSRPMLHTLCVRCGLAARERAPRQVLTSAQVPPSALTRTRTRARYLHRVAHQTFSSALQAPTLRTAR